MHVDAPFFFQIKDICTCWALRPEYTTHMWYVANMSSSTFESHIPKLLVIIFFKKMTYGRIGQTALNLPFRCLNWEQLVSSLPSIYPSLLMVARPCCQLLRYCTAAHVQLQLRWGGSSSSGAALTRERERERGLKPVVALLLLGLCSSLSESQLGGLRTRKFKGMWVLILF